MNKKNIIILDDDQFICQSLEILFNKDYNINSFTNINSASEYLDKANQKVDLIILDYNIGKDNGIEFFKKEISDKKRDIPGIIISGFLVSQFKDDNEIKKIDKYFIKLFEKPFDIIELKAYISDWFKKN